ncbi:MAG: ATP-binding protein [Candidatus Sericytochromatia bacterium]
MTSFSFLQTAGDGACPPGEYAELRAVIENATDAIFVKDLEGRYVLMNQAGATLMGCTAAEVAGKFDHEIFDAETARRLRDNDLAMLANPEVLSFEESLPVDGELRHYWTTKYPYHDAEGRVAGLIGISRDVTERKAMEERQLRANTAHALRSDVSQAIAAGSPIKEMLTACLEALVRHLGAGFARVWLVNPLEQVLEWQAGAGNEPPPSTMRIPIGAFMLGHVAKTGRPYMTTDAQHDPLVAPLHGFLAEHGLSVGTGYPLVVDGRLVGVLGMFGTAALSDTTLELLGTVADSMAQGLERKRLEDELKRQNEQLKALDRMKSVFVSSVSHELRTPLTSILGFSEFLEDELEGPLTPGQAGYVAQIQASTGRLQRLVDDLLDFARLEAGTFRLNVAEADLGAIARRVIDGLRPQLDAKGLELRLGFPDGLPALRLDPARIEQVLVILLDNAIKFTPDGGALTVTLAAVDGAMRVSVQDTGPGIAEADQPRLFDQFYQVDSGLTRTTGGTGLGLSIAKALVEAHGGRIGVESEPGAGSAFWFELPAG